MNVVTLTNNLHSGSRMPGRKRRAISGGALELGNTVLRTQGQDLMQIVMNQHWVTNGNKYITLVQDVSDKGNCASRG